MKVMEERCDQCLYGPNKIVSNARRSQIIRDITRKDCHFICHKASIAGQDVACRGDFDQRGCGQLGRIMGRLGAIEFVKEESLSRSPQESSSG
jgi:hypothetical protein